MAHRKENASLPHPMLHLLYGTTEKKPRPLDREAVIIGRARGCDLCLDAPDVSSIHCVITRGPRGLRVRDCASRAGIKVNGEPVTATFLHDGDLLQIGPFSFKVTLPPTAPEEGVDPLRLQHLEKSRRQLARLALHWRRRCRDFQNKPDGLHEELERKAGQLRERIRSYDQRFNQLEEAELELSLEKEALNREHETHRAHVQQIEADLAFRCQEVDQEIHSRWQEFQQRCQREEEDRRKARDEAQLNGSAQVPGAANLREREQELDLLASHLADQEKQLSHKQQEIAQTLHLIAQEKQECQRLKDEWTRQQALAEEHLHQERQTLAEAEQLLVQQRNELARLLVEFQKVHQNLTLQHQEHSHSLVEENDHLRRLLAERECQLLQTMASLEIPPTQEEASTAPLEEENHQLRRHIQELEGQLAMLHKRPAHVVGVESSANDLASWEAEINQFRQQLEAERQHLNAEREQLQFRQAELAEATRDMEMELSRERADLARERIRLDRLREEVRVELDKVQREAVIRENLVPVQRLREEIQRKQPNLVPPPPPRDGQLEERLVSFRQRLLDQ